MKHAPASFSELRADWLKLRGVLWDSTTELPSLPAVLDDVRRRLEGNENLGLVYLDLSADGSLEPAFGWQGYDHLLREVSRALRDSRTALLEERDSLALVNVRSDEFVLFVGLTETDTDPKAQIERIRHAVTERVRARLAETFNGESPQVLLHSASTRVDVDPTVRIERAIYKSLQRARELCRMESQKRQSGRLREIDRILGERDVVIRYQPIVRLDDGEVLGYEALSSAPHDEVFETPDLMFAFAEETDRIGALEQLCRQEALSRSRSFLRSPGEHLFLNCSAPAFTDPRLVEDLVGAAESTGIPPGNIVVEVTERVAITEWQAFQKALMALREAGLRIAIDDMGSGYSSLRVVAEIEPDFLKLDLSLVTDIHRTPIKRDLLETLVLLAEKIEADPIAEGIEVPEELETLQRLGVRYGQGYLFARPRVPGSFEPLHFPA